MCHVLSSHSFSLSLSLSCVYSRSSFPHRNAGVMCRVSNFVVGKNHTITFTTKDSSLRAAGQMWADWVRGIEAVLRGRFEPIDVAEYYIGKKYLQRYHDAGQVLPNEQSEIKEETKGFHNSIQPLVGQSLIIGCNGSSEQSILYLVEMLSKVRYGNGTPPLVGCKAAILCHASPPTHSALLLGAVLSDTKPADRKPHFPTRF
jgi:hypothetical protein